MLELDRPQASGPQPLFFRLQHMHERLELGVLAIAARHGAPGSMRPHP